jgi:glycosyltransferase involved in cell wall biosynthesis
LPFLSVIIPVYNVENYLDQCLQSIMNQDCSDIEIILIDNASTDRSGAMCDDYASNHQNVKVKHLKKNALPSGARNAGLKIAEGEYIHFCDSDDNYLDNSFDKIKSEFAKHKPDVLFTEYISIPEKGAFVPVDTKIDPTIFNNSDPTSIVESLLKMPKKLFTPWRLVIKREFLLSKNIWFPEEYHFEDVEWFAKVVCSSECFHYLSDPIYCYRPRASGSITSVKTFEYNKSQLAVSMNLLTFINDRKMDDLRKEYIYDVVNFALDLFSTCLDTFSRDQIKQLAEIIQENRVAFDMLKFLPKQTNFYHLVNLFGGYYGLVLYRTYVIETTLNLVLGKENNHIYVFPTGYNGEGTARILREAGYKVKGFLDNSTSKQGSNIEGLLVDSPAVLKTLPSLEEIFVVVTIQQEQISNILSDQLKDLGLTPAQIAKRIF